MSQTLTDGNVLRRAWKKARPRLGALVVVGAAFVLALALARGIFTLAQALFSIGEPGTLPRLLAGVVALQVVGFGSVVGMFLWRQGDSWSSTLRIGPVTEWTVFYGAAVGLALMLVTSLATGMFRLLDVEPATSAVGVAADPHFYVVLFAVSTVVVVPLEEAFFRGFVQARLEESFHAVVAIGVASLCFMLVHIGVSVGTGGEALALGLFFSLGVVLGVGYHVTDNLLVPIIGHALFNGSQILVRTAEVMG